MEHLKTQQAVIVSAAGCDAKRNVLRWATLHVKFANDTRDLPQRHT